MIRLDHKHKISKWLELLISGSISPYINPHSPFVKEATMVHMAMIAGLVIFAVYLFCKSSVGSAAKVTIALVVIVAGYVIVSLYYHVQSVLG